MRTLRSLGALALCLIAASAWAGGQGDTGVAAKTEITYLAWYNTTQSEAADIQNNLIDPFNEQHPNIHVTLMTIPRDGYETRINTLAAAGQLPDTAISSEAMTITLAAAGLLADVGDMYKPEEAPLKTVAFTYNGKVVGYSSGNEVLLLYYNRKLFDAAGLAYPPAGADKAWTWREYVEAAKKLTRDKNGRTPNDAGFDERNILTYGTDFNRLWWMWPIVTYSNGGGLISPDGKELWIGKPESMEAMQMLADLYVKDHVAPSVGDKANMPSLDLTLLTDRVAMATSGQWEIGVSLKNSLKDGLVYGVGVLPKMKQAVTYNTGGPFVAFTTSKHLAEAKTFIKWMGDDKNSWPQIVGGILMPVLARSYASETAMREWADNDVHPPFEMYKTAVIDYAMNNSVQVPWYYFNGYEGLNDILESGIEGVWNGKVTAREYITGILPRLQAYFDEHKAK